MTVLHRSSWHAKLLTFFRFKLGRTKYGHFSKVLLTLLFSPLLILTIGCAKLFQAEDNKATILIFEVFWLLALVLGPILIHLYSPESFNYLTAVFISIMAVLSIAGGVILYVFTLIWLIHKAPNWYDNKLKGVIQSLRKWITKRGGPIHWRE